MKTVFLTGDNLTHDALAQAFGFPEYYGRNLDALHDCLTDLHEETDLSIVHPEALLETLGPAYVRLTRVLSNAAEENPYLKLHL